MTFTPDPGLLLEHRQLVARILVDERLQTPGQHQVRDLGIAMAWGIYCAPPDTVWDNVRVWYAADDDHQVRWAIREDLPRYQVPTGDVAEGRAPCVAPMIRRDGLCGQPASRQLVLWDPATGEGREVAYCHQDRHVALYREERDRQRQLVDSGALPEPMPNRGGVLPGYFRAWPWEKLYRWSMVPHQGERWIPPKVGIVADDWPVVAKQKARELLLRLVDGGGQGPDDDAEPAPPPPALRLIYDGEAWT